MCSAVSEHLESDGYASVGLDCGWRFVFGSCEQLFGVLPSLKLSLICAFIPSSCCSIPDGCFSGSPRLSRVTFGRCNAVPADFQDCSIGCGGLREADVSCSAGSIGEGCSRCWEAQESPSAMSGLRGLSSSLSRRTPRSGSALKRIGKEAFSSCNELRELEIPAGVEEIGEGCFRGCDVSGLRFSGESGTFRVMGGFIIRVEGMCAVCAFRRLREVEIPASVEEIGEGCFRCSSLSRVTFASGSALKRIGKEAFRECEELLELEIPASVEEIGEGCFWESTLSRVTFASGSALKRIGKEAFWGCKELRQLEIPASVELLGDIGVRVRRV